MATRTITTRLALDGEKEFKKQMSEVNSSLSTLKSEMKLVDEQFRGQANSADYLAERDRVLRDEIDQQTEKVRALEQALKDATEVYGDADAKVDAYKRQLNYAKTDLHKLNGELQDNDKYLREARDSADKCAKSIDGFGREVKDAGDSFQSPLQGLDDLVSGLGDLGGLLAGGAAVGALTAGLSAIKGGIDQVVEGSEEWRRVMGTLEVSSQAAGYTTEETAEAFDRLYGVLGDSQQAATTVANLQAIGLSQEDLMVMIDNTIGAWARYGDSIPIDGLAEAINETIRVGQVTGTFADALNWAGQSEDEFNAKLAEATTQAERQDLVLQTLAQQGLAQSADAWYAMNEDIVAANDSQRAFEEAQAALGERLSPIKDALTDLASGGFNFLAGAIDTVVQDIKDLGEWWDKTAAKLSQGWDKFWGTSSDLEERRKAAMAVPNIDGSHAQGLSYVPYDGYVAELHKGEAVLTAQENAALLPILQGKQTVERGGVSMADVREAVAQGNQAMVAELRSVGREMVAAIEAHGDVYLDGDTLTDKITQTQNKRNRMYGRTLQKI